jgi:hypothetical protein
MKFKLKLTDTIKYNFRFIDATQVSQPLRYTEYKGILLGVNNEGKDVAYSEDKGETWFKPSIDRYNGRERIDIRLTSGARVRLFVHRLVIFLWGSTSEGFITYKNGNKYSFSKIAPQSIPLNWVSNKENIIIHIDGNNSNNKSTNLTVLRLNEQNIHTTAKNWVTSSWLESVQKIGKDLFVEFKNESKKKGNSIVLIKYPLKGLYYRSLLNSPSKGKWIWQNLIRKPLGQNDNYEIVGYRK